MAEKAVRVMFPGLTVSGKIYSEGEIEPNPSKLLIDMAGSKEMRVHSDSKRKLRLAKFIKLDDDGDEIEFDDLENIRTPIYDIKEEYNDELNDAKKPELLVLAGSLGMKKDFMKKMDKSKLIKIVRFMRKI